MTTTAPSNPWKIFANRHLKVNRARCAACAAAFAVLIASPHTRATTTIQDNPEPTITAPTIAEPPIAEPEPFIPGLFSVNANQTPRVTLAWTTNAGDRAELAAALPYGVDTDRVAMGSNVETYIAVGGTRIGKNAAHPEGSIVRAGFYKTLAPRAFFEDIRPGTPVEFRLEGVAFNRPANPIADTIVMHLKYNPADLISCGLPPGAFECFNLRSLTDTMNDRTVPGEDTRLGVLDPANESGATSNAILEDDGTVTLTASIPYGLFRHLQDPWKSELPGTFLEPIHFHIEVEVLPEGVEPLDIDAMRREIEAIRARLREFE